MGAWQKLDLGNTVCDVTLVDQPRSSSYNCYLEGLVASITLASPGGAWPWASICQGLHLGFILWLASTSDRYMANRKGEQVGNAWGMAEDLISHP